MNQNTDGHLSPGEISAYLANAMTGSKRDQAEDHLSLCPVCRKELIQASRAPGRRQPVRWIAAAVPVLAAAALAFLFLLPGTETGLPSSSTSDSALRIRGDADSARFGLLTPEPDQVVDLTGLVFTWSSADTGASYRVTVANRGGDVVWTGRTVDTVLSLPDSVTLQVGDSYFWYVDALLPGALTSSTTVQEFSVGR